MTEGQLFMDAVIQCSVVDGNSVLQQDSVEVSAMGEMQPRLGTLGERLRHARERRGWDQPELSEKSGVKISTISEIEQGRIKRTSFAHNLATALRCRVEWLQDNDGPMEDPVAARELALPYRSDTIYIPQLDFGGSMGGGVEAPDHIDVVNQVQVNLPQLRREVSFTAPQNLRIITGYGDSMEPTFKDGDPLLMDTGVNEFAIDGIYVFQKAGATPADPVFIKRVQRHPIDATIIVSSDNKNYQPYVVEPKRTEFRILGRVLLAWNSRKL